jgi:hypothetical protein
LRKVQRRHPEAASALRRRLDKILDYKYLDFKIDFFEGE